jgi:lipopolysaccharide export system ATP-binding protein
MSTLRTQELTKSYSGRTVVRGVSLEVGSGEVVGLLGPNGAGKTTTFYMVVGLTAPESGRVVLDGEDLTDDPMYVRARKGIGYLPQEPSIFRGLTVEQNILAILETLELPKAERRERLENLLAELSLEGAGAYAVGWRASARRNHSGARRLTAFHAARRAICGHRPDRRDRYSENHLSPARARDRIARD